MTRGQFAYKVLKGLNIHTPTIHQRRALQAWMQAEGGSARANPLNTTLKLANSTDYNSVGVQNYLSADNGVLATVSTLKQNAHGYPEIRHRLHRNASAGEILSAVGASDWGTDSKLALAVLDDIKRGRKPNTLSELEAKVIPA